MIALEYPSNKSSQNCQSVTSGLRTRIGAPGGMRIHIAIALHYSPDYFQALEVALRSYASFGSWEVVCHVLTNTVDVHELKEIEALFVKTLGATAAAKVAIHSFPDLDHPFMLTWQHKKIISEVFLNDSHADLFIYTEHDIVISRENIEYYLWAREILSQSGLIPGFVRYECTDTVSVVVDFVRPFSLRGERLKVIDGERFAVDYPPYCAFFVLDRELAIKHKASPAFTESGSRRLTDWEVRERAAMGPLYSDVPAGRTHRYALLLDSGYLPDPRAQVWHATNNYSADPASPFSKIHLAKSISPKLSARMKSFSFRRLIFKK